MNREAVLKAIQHITAKWERQRKKEERDARAAANRRQALTKSQQVEVIEAAFKVMPEAYEVASNAGTYPAFVRQMFYPARGPIQQQTGLPLSDRYFCNKLVPRYLRENPKTTAKWDVVFDARGHLTEPHTERIVPLGSLDVRHYLGDMRKRPRPVGDDPFLFPTTGPRNRYATLLFIEKEGFMPLFKAAKLADRFDMAIMSTKGLSTTASRHLVDMLSGIYEVTLLILRDFDKAGFSIARTLVNTTERYAFKHDLGDRAFDLGLRLEDATEWGLESEKVFYGKTNPMDNLRKNGATAEEIKFLFSGYEYGVGHFGHRVELNALPSKRLLEYIEAKLVLHGIKKVVPDSATLDIAFRLAAKNHIVNDQLKRLARRAKKQAGELAIPDTLAEIVHSRLAENPSLSWDEVVSDIAGESVRQE
jgi:hypothetical protein